MLNDPAEFFTSQKDPETGEPVFGSFDAEGFPQTDAAGAALAKGTVKKCTKTLKVRRNNDPKAAILYSSQL